MDATILVNRTHRLPRKAIPQILVEPEIIFDAPVGDRKRLLAVSAAKGVEALFARGKEEGIYLCGVSGYRSYERQEELYQKKLREQPKGNEGSVHWIAPPGAVSIRRVWHWMFPARRLTINWMSVSEKPGKAGG